MEYKAKSLIEGFKVDNKFVGKKLVAVPLNKSNIGNLIFVGNQLMRIRTEPLKHLTFEDKFGRGTYTLCYFEWKPEPLWG
jgi:hypothetical protein